jgi:hypothetical protein
MNKLHDSGMWEMRTIHAMIRIYCGQVHHQKELCGECEELLAYAGKRIAKCRFGKAKPACKECPVHCYAPHMRDKIREVMRFSGPRMIYRHPLMSLIHLLKAKNKNSVHLQLTEKIK